eukprot:2067369-Prymnesium_polylepis.1
MATTKTSSDLSSGRRLPSKSDEFFLVTILCTLLSHKNIPIYQKTRHLMGAGPTTQFVRLKQFPVALCEPFPLGMPMRSGMQHHCIRQRCAETKVHERCAARGECS